MGARRLTLEVPAPFRLDLTVWALRRRPHNAVDLWDGDSWRRSVATGEGAVELTVRQTRGRDAPRLAISVGREGAAPGSSAVAEVRRLVIRTLGLDVDLAGFYVLARRDPRLATLALRFAGMRPPRFPSVFEALVNAVACQQLSLDVGIHLLNRLGRRFCPAPRGSGAPPSLPSPDVLAAADASGLRELGFSRAKARALVALGQMVTAAEVDLESLDALDDAAARDLLAGLPGIGRWSAEYALLRGLGRLHVLPGDDVGARNNLRRRFGLAADAGYDAVAELSRGWWPYGGLVYFHLLLDRLAEWGQVEPAVVGPAVVGPLSADAGTAPARGGS